MDDKLQEENYEAKSEDAHVETEDTAVGTEQTGTDAQDAAAGTAQTDPVPETEENGGDPQTEDASAADDAEKPSDDGQTGSDGEAETSSDGKWHVFGKKKAKKDPKDEKIEELTDQLRRSLAEFDNYRKRTEKEKSAMFEVGARNIIERILPVIDNFERGLASISEDTKGTAFAEGMEMIYKQLLKNLEEAGVKPIEAVGQPFDPNFHNAVMHVEDENLGENVVAQEFQKGYMYRDTVVRHSMVQVAN